MHTLIPPEVSASAHPRGRFSRWFGFGLTPRALLLLLAGLAFAVPEFYHPIFRVGRFWLMLAWDALMLALVAFDVAMLPPPAVIRVTRRFLVSPSIGEQTGIEYEVTQNGRGLLHVAATDSLHPALMKVPQAVELVVYPREPARVSVSCRPRERGDLLLGKIYLRYRGALGLVERWAVCDTEQRIRVFPAMPQDAAADLYLIRARQIEMQKRRLRLRGIGREFESLRDYQRGDELRNISWTATARRAKLITRQFTTERSQQVWIVLDAGRLSRTAFHLQRETPDHETPDHEMPDRETLDNEAQRVVTQLDQAAGAAVMLAQVISSSGDKFALLTYGRRVQQQLLPGNGAPHLRLLIDLLSQTRSERAEANHLGAASRLKHLQRRRGLILWITEMADSVGRPEVVTAAAELVRRHLVVLVLLEHPELDRLGRREPATVEEMFAATAAAEILERRTQAITRLRQQGVLVVETTPGDVGAASISKYLEVKAQGLL